MRRFFRWMINYIQGSPGDWAGKPQSAMIAPVRPTSAKGFGYDYDPDREFIELGTKRVTNPRIAFHEAIVGKPDTDNPFAGKVRVVEAYLFEGKFDSNGKLMKDKTLLEASHMPQPFRTKRIVGHDAYVEAMKKAKKTFESLPEKIEKAEAVARKKIAGLESMREKKLIEQDEFTMGSDNIATSYDMAQYTEFTPIYGGPFNKQLYLYDYLTMHARAFEEKNHNPVAKRIIDVLAQYSFGRRFKVRIADARQKKAWEDFEAKNNIIHRMSEFWIREYLTYGELMINKNNWQSVDPSTVWDIITDPDDITNVYYYYQSYPTAYMQFTGYSVPGAGGGKNVPPMEYIIRQIPYTQMIHIKGNVVSQEKRGRSVLFPVLGWLKRLKDLYNAEVLRSQLEACFIWDDTIIGSDADVQNHISKFAGLPQPASIFAHNEQVKRAPMQALSSGARSSLGVGDELLALIATAIGIPKDFLNIMSTSGGGSRATALVGAEPFEKVVEDLQAKFENLLLAIVEEVMEDAGLNYKKGDVEFIFPSVTKDTTTETIKNVAMGESLGYISRETAGDMYAGEMNITTYEYEKEQSKIKNQPPPPAMGMPPEGRFGVSPNGNGQGEPDGVVHNDDSPIHGVGKSKLKNQLKNI
jgi:hypothetical protein